MSTTYPTGSEDEREAAIEAAAQAVQRGGLVVLPTDTVYGVGADAFDHAAVQALLDAKGRGREMPPPVLISAATTLSALASNVQHYVEALTEAFWPGPLTLVCDQQPSLTWDLGETRGTVAVRMPDHEVALALLERTGPLAVSSANLSGLPAAVEAPEAEGMLGDSVEVVLDDGPSPRGESSTILDVRLSQPRLLRRGALAVTDLNDVLQPLGCTVVEDDDEEPVALVEPAKKTAKKTAKKAPAKKTAARKTPAKKTAAKKTAAKKTAAKKTATRKTTATNTTDTAKPAMTADSERPEGATE